MSKEITIPRNLIYLCYDGRKTRHASLRCYVKIGEIFYLDGVAYQCGGIQRIKLIDEMKRYWKEEGATSPRGFMLIWNAAHVESLFEENMEKTIFITIFKRMNEDIDSRGI
jgi:hypothetical protein